MIITELKLLPGTVPVVEPRLELVVSGDEL